jgi:hypothetical protein
MALVFGTVSVAAMQEALRADHARHSAPADQVAQLRQHIRDAFYINTPEWRAQVIVQARQALFQAVAGVSDARE